MATSLLWLGQLGSLKALQRESWGLLRCPSVAAFCTKVEEPKKAVKKAKAAKAAAAPLAPAPEPFDNSTYKNLQHHNYNHYTFADLDLEMAKYRLPQPSSGRPSPRH
ncbi:NADH dehydrogenase [ubiquinone] flavoprotein 3, mitochondrial [Salmo salar]|uniref:NADH dehydrogenase [ubiquinone] flavoprotein 3, mitochondrial n=1 Tax=Salmo salar TaxID=8030 RepID=B5XA23_SALSA|nr:NADH dehydrogenase [ubiquinone] flavoprotein 3, mitochondrial [Salmo salar]ACI67693.1 NADH dehydrogenase flavoprotein 3, mitochondrial precursor [Salmo salar]